jgi:hypothetical protein
MSINSGLSGEKIASIAAGARRCAFMRRTKEEKAIPVKWPIRTRLFAETAFAAFRNVPGALWKNLWIRTF